MIKKNKQMWSVIISVYAMGKEVIGKRKRIYDKEYMESYCHTNVTKFYRKKNMLYIMEGKKEHVYDENRIKEIQIREHKQTGAQYINKEV